MDAAIRSFQKSMHDFPWDPDSPHRIGRILIEQKKPDQAMRYLQEALRREPEFPEVMNAIAYIHLLAGDLNAAEKELNKSFERAPANPEALMLMANIQHRKGQFDAEIALLKEAVVNTGSHRPAMVLAQRFGESGNFKQDSPRTWAREDLRRLMEKEPD